MPCLAGRVTCAVFPALPSLSGGPAPILRRGRLPGWALLAAEGLPPVIAWLVPGLHSDATTVAH